MIYCALRSMFGMIISIALMTTTQASAQCFSPIESKEETISIKFTSTQELPLHLYAWEAQGDSGLETHCTATISVPVSLFPTARLVSRPSEFASNIREVVSKWDLNECAVVVWINNDMGDDVREEDLCRFEKFRFDGDSVWSSSSEKSCTNGLEI